MNKTVKQFFLFATHMGALGIGFALGIYLLPIISAPPAPSDAEVTAAMSDAKFTGEFRRDLQDSDALHWGEGKVFVSNTAVSLQGEVAPGPAYRLYLSPKFVETEEAFLQTKSEMAFVGDVKTFKNFIVSMPAGVDPAQRSDFLRAAETRPIVYYSGAGDNVAKREENAGCDRRLSTPTPPPAPRSGRAASGGSPPPPWGGQWFRRCRRT